MKQEPKCRYPRCSCNSKDFCDPKRQEALDKKAENARELGLDYEPVQAEKQEPVAYPDGYVVGPCICGSWPGGKCLKCPRIPPQPQREWVGLTDDEVTQQVGDSQVLRDVVRAVEHVLKEKNT
jgi:hypothetical protein